MQKQFLIFGGFSAAICVILGAMGAHFFKMKLESGIVTVSDLQTFETAVKYQMYHSLALILLASLNDRLKDKLFQKAAYCFMLGIVLFSGSLYLLATANLIGLPTMRWLGPITPIGGLFFIAGWVIVGFAGLKRRD